MREPRFAVDNFRSNRIATPIISLKTLEAQAKSHFDTEMITVASLICAKIAESHMPSIIEMR